MTNESYQALGRFVVNALLFLAFLAVAILGCFGSYHLWPGPITLIPQAFVSVVCFLSWCQAADWGEP